ncbi:uncharacterized protein LOC111026655 [Myzus persicae]|uniref:uncharacterized protein LOC111026655 n=1 Tax=Myzus persicae TaxID=13164 RepID=UPI000B92FA3C|nr:uncharacterized protein LOC111026655 [Myzus persicae]
MQGHYSGLKTRIQEENPRAIYVWCSAHIFNLVVVDTCDCCLETKSFFGNISSLVEFMRARKRTAIFLKWQGELYSQEQKRRLKRFSSTSWSSHDRVLIVVQEKYFALLKTLNELTTLKDSDRDMIVNDAKLFVHDKNLEEKDFKQTRPRKIKMMSGEKTRDEISSSPSDMFRRNVYYKVLDAIITSITVRFSDSREILKDLCLLSPERLMTTNENKLPQNAFDNLQKWIVHIDKIALRTEYLTFRKSLSELLNGHELKFNYSTPNYENSHISSDDSPSPSSDENEEKTEDNNEQLSCIKILELLSSYGLIDAFPNLYMAYKSLSTIPISSASAERSFSKVKLIKNRLRSSTGQSRLESLLILSTEKDIPIDINSVIDQVALSSEINVFLNCF